VRVFLEKTMGEWAHTGKYYDGRSGGGDESELIMLESTESERAFDKYGTKYIEGRGGWP
jgi:hypothetical protein